MGWKVGHGLIANKAGMGNICPIIQGAWAEADANNRTQRRGDTEMAGAHSRLAEWAVYSEPKRLPVGVDFSSIRHNSAPRQERQVPGFGAERVSFPLKQAEHARFKVRGLGITACVLYMEG